MWFEMTVKEKIATVVMYNIIFALFMGPLVLLFDIMGLLGALLVELGIAYTDWQREKRKEKNK